MGKPIKKLLQEQKYKAIIGDPESQVGHDMLRYKSPSAAAKCAISPATSCCA
jgi:hypothetical protein